MTSVTFSRVRVVALTLGLAGALALTGCSDDGGGSGDSKASPTPSATAPSGNGATASPEGPASDLEGSWLATTGGKAVALVVNGEQAGLFATGGTVCSGSAREDAGTTTIRLKCTNGNKDRTTGTVDSVSKKSLKVTWDSGLGTETYQKAEGGKLPPGLPTEGLGSAAP
ncbi:hypothetical protein GCM10009601_41100 [Streptomyces thermospinosisporus]|uniref:Serine/threonine protein kinase n=1 Tax=Streptomyces thermospinosisporus TaxID=161482 RepID=A0ABP4JT64_9ACTN